jgi:ribosomal protein L28
MIGGLFRKLYFVSHQEKLFRRKFCANLRESKLRIVTESQPTIPSGAEERV